MKLLYFECKMGAAGDMIMGALYDLLDEKGQQEFLSQMNGLQIPGVTLLPSRQQKCGVYGTHMHVMIDGVEELEHHHHHDHTHDEHEHHHTHDEHEHHHTHDEHAHHHTHDEHEHHHHHEHTHHHASYTHILHEISHLPLPEKVRADAASVYKLIGEAEAKAHQTDITQIHFHEVGTLDALLDVVGCCLLIHMLQPDKILASPIHVGNGTVSCAHGILPVPAPATAEILKGVPIYSGNINSELCTPTGAALLKHFAASFTAMPPMSIAGTGYGMGTKDFPQANCIRALLGEDLTVPEDDTILALSCNLDDITGEALAFAMEELLRQGARDVFTTPIGMKKGRPGQLLTCLCTPSMEDKMTRLIFLHTTTRGIRVQEYRRHVLASSFSTTQTPYGEVTLKTNQGYGVEKTKAEYEDLAKIAREKGIGIDSILD